MAFKLNPNSTPHYENNHLSQLYSGLLEETRVPGENERNRESPPGPSRCEATLLTAHPPCRPIKYSSCNSYSHNRKSDLTF